MTKHRARILTADERRMNREWVRKNLARYVTFNKTKGGKMMVCGWCGEEARFSRLLDTWWCSECRQGEAIVEYDRELGGEA